MEKERTQFINQFIVTNGHKFKIADLVIIRKKLETLKTEQMQLLCTVNYLDPTMITIVSVLIGHWGFDRFFIKQIGLGILKLFTGGGGGIWTIVDWFRIGGLTKKANMKKFNENLMLIK
jgi:hypothetical protein